MQLQNLTKNEQLEGKVKKVAVRNEDSLVNGNLIKHVNET